MIEGADDSQEQAGHPKNGVNNCCCTLAVHSLGLLSYTPRIDRLVLFALDASNNLRWPHTADLKSNCTSGPVKLCLSTVTPMLCWVAGSCLVLKGNGADIAQHCVPPVGARRMSITLRR